MWLLSIILLRLSILHIISSSFLLLLGSTKCHVLFIHALIKGCLDCFPFLPIVNTAAYEPSCISLFSGHMYSLFIYIYVYIYIGEELLGHKQVYATLLEMDSFPQKLCQFTFSLAMYESSSDSTSSSALLAVPVGVQWYLIMVLMLNNDIEHLYIYLLATWCFLL